MEPMTEATGTKWDRKARGGPREAGVGETGQADAGAGLAPASGPAAARPVCSEVSQLLWASVPVPVRNVTR